MKLPIALTVGLLALLATTAFIGPAAAETTPTADTGPKSVAAQSGDAIIGHGTDSDDRRNGDAIIGGEKHPDGTAPDGL